MADKKLVPGQVVLFKLLPGRKSPYYEGYKQVNNSIGVVLTVQSNNVVWVRHGYTPEKQPYILAELHILPEKAFKAEICCAGLGTTEIVVLGGTKEEAIAYATSFIDNPSVESFEGYTILTTSLGLSKDYKSNKFLPFVSKVTNLEDTIKELKKEEW